MVITRFKKWLGAAAVTQMFLRYANHGVLLLLALGYPQRKEK